MHMFAPFLTLDGWIALATLTVLEVVLGIDNIIFLAIVANRVEGSQRKVARRIGLLLALAMRIGLLASISWIISLGEPIITTRCSATPTAVTIESIENTMSNIAIWNTAAASVEAGAW